MGYQPQTAVNRFSELLIKFQELDADTHMAQGSLMGESMELMRYVGYGEDLDGMDYEDVKAAVIRTLCKAIYKNGGASKTLVIPTRDEVADTIKAVRQAKEIVEQHYPKIEKT